MHAPWEVGRGNKLLILCVVIGQIVNRRGSFHHSLNCFWDCYGRCAGQLLGTLRSNEADGNENVKKTIGLIRKKATLHVHHAFLYISRPVFARLRREQA